MLAVGFSCNKNDGDPSTSSGQADDDDSLKRARDAIQRMLVRTEAMEEHKREQLRALAEINGTVRDDVYCRLCGKMDHKAMNCPSRSLNCRIRKRLKPRLSSSRRWNAARGNHATMDFLTWYWGAPWGPGQMTLATDTTAGLRAGDIAHFSLLFYRGTINFEMFFVDAVRFSG